MSVIGEMGCLSSDGALLHGGFERRDGAVVVGSHLGLRISNFAPEKPSNGAKTITSMGAFSERRRESEFVHRQSRRSAP
jgi:hypothetical protein